MRCYCVKPHLIQMIKNKVYIIPGLGENCDLIRYKYLANLLLQKKYEVVLVNPNWYKPLTQLTFPVESEAIIIGFSFGAILAYLIAKKMDYKKAFLCSISPIHDFSYNELVEDYSHHMKKENAEELARDIKSIKIDLKTIRTPYITIIGDQEIDLLKDSTPDIVVPNTRHFLSKKYAQTILSFFE